MAMQRQLRLLATDKAPAGVAQEPTSLKVAFATTNLKTVDQHFGSAERFAVYLIEPGASTLHSVAEFGQLQQDGNENKLVEKFALLDGCAAVFCHAIGASAIRQLLALGIQPLKVPEGASIAQLVENLKKELAEGPAGWIARAIEMNRPKDPSRFDEMELEGWEE